MFKIGKNTITLSQNTKIRKYFILNNTFSLFCIQLNKLTI